MTEDERYAALLLRHRRMPLAQIGRLFGMSVNTLRARLDNRVAKAALERSRDPEVRQRAKEWRRAKCADPDYRWRQKCRAAGVALP